MSEADFRHGPAEDRLRRVTDELLAIAAQIDAIPPRPVGALAAMQIDAVAMVKAAKRVANAVIDAAHRVPRAEDA